ncbi:hypothetical protein COLO4_33178 [Corchorus olitorius]|uniref:Uncharacterized protein n=1 Tax=Corchorus olitorius TaxID=93759 RepID=A0A1R3GVR7_9ROSI|nr:hypothetical protein COLO4_33178 [Corchorus olitorius]
MDGSGTFQNGSPICPLPESSSRFTRNRLEMLQTCKNPIALKPFDLEAPPLHHSLLRVESDEIRMKL